MWICYIHVVLQYIAIRYTIQHSSLHSVRKVWKHGTPLFLTLYCIDFHIICSIWFPPTSGQLCRWNTMFLCTQSCRSGLTLQQVIIIRSGRCFKFCMFLNPHQTVAIPTLCILVVEIHEDFQWTNIGIFAYLLLHSHKDTINKQKSICFLTLDRSK